ncbi:MAG: AMIN domain-containing protein [Verrucomicrobia bacterium]|nr:AMIN domain-containing protein [Leptolyngbya sp. ES-bin-22]
MQSSDGYRLLRAAIAALSAVTADATFLSVQAASLTNWSFDPAANQLEITVKDGTTPRYFLMAQPARIVVDLPDTAVGAVSAQKTYSGAVRQIRVSQFEPGLTRIVMEISPGVALAPGQVKLQKVGNDTTQSGNSRWVLQPLITKSLSANAVTVKPSVPAQPRPRVMTPVASAAKPLTASPLFAPSTLPSLTRTNTPIVQPQTAKAGNNSTSSATLPSPPNRSSSSIELNSPPATTARPTTESGNANKPTVVVPGISATPTTMAPTTSVALAPVLPSLPTAVAPVKTPTPAAANPVDPNVAVDVQGGVAIAVPTPTTPSPTKSAPPQPLAVMTAPADPTLQSTTRFEASRVDRAPLTVKPASATATAATRRSTNSPLVQPVASAPSSLAASGLAASEIPTTLGATSFAPTPSVSVPPLTAFGAVSAPSNIAEAQSRKADVAADIPSDGLPADGNTQPRVSVPPPIRVGTPSLGASNGVPSIVESAPPTSVFSPNASLIPPVNMPPLQQTTAPLAVQPAAAQSFYDANTVTQSSSRANLAPPLNLVPLQAPLQQPTPKLPETTPGYDASTIRRSPTTSAPASIVEFGQPLPATSGDVTGQPFSGRAASPGVRQAFNPAAPNVLLPVGTVLNLRYPGNSTLMLRTDRPQQEILVLLTELRDASGNLLALAGSTVTGRFETTAMGSQFVTQAIAVSGRSLPLVAQSEPLGGSRKVEGNNLARNSGIGVLAGGVLGALGGSTGLGALGGAAAGAAATLLTAPKPAAIQPGQIVQVRLTQDLRSAE